MIKEAIVNDRGSMRAPRCGAGRLAALGFMLALSAAWPSASAGDDGSDRKSVGALPETWGVAIPVDDLEAALTLWTEALAHSIVGDERDERDGRPESVQLQLDDLRLILYVGRGEDPGDRARVYPNYEVVDPVGLAAAVDRHGGRSDARRENAIGYSVPTRDPSGNRFHLMKIDGRSPADDPGIQPFNVGITVPEIEPLEAFLGKLGQEASTRSYLPQTLPFQKRGRFPLVVHRGASGPALEGDRRSSLVLSVPDLDDEARRLERVGIEARRESAPWGNGSVLAVDAPGGLMILIVERSVDGTRREAP